MTGLERLQQAIAARWGALNLDDAAGKPGYRRAGRKDLPNAEYAIEAGPDPAPTWAKRTREATVTFKLRGEESGTRSVHGIVEDLVGDADATPSGFEGWRPNVTDGAEPTPATLWEAETVLELAAEMLVDKVEGTEHWEATVVMTCVIGV